MFSGLYLTPCKILGVTPQPLLGITHSTIIPQGGYMETLGLDQLVPFLCHRGVWMENLV